MKRQTMVNNELTFDWCLISCCEHLILYKSVSFYSHYPPPRSLEETPRITNPLPNPPQDSVDQMFEDVLEREGRPLQFGDLATKLHRPWAVFGAFGGFCSKPESLMWRVVLSPCSHIWNTGLVNDWGIFRASYLWYIYIRCIPQTEICPLLSFFLHNNIHLAKGS